jgi:CRP-like cAMP-binding protein
MVELPHPEGRLTLRPRDGNWPPLGFAAGPPVCKSQWPPTRSPSKGLSAITADTFTERFPALAQSLSSDELGGLIEAFDVHDADAGETLVAEGTHTGDLFLVCEGSLDIAMRGPAGERRLASVGPGSYFGEVSLLDPGPAGASVVTEQGCTVLRLSRARLDELRRRAPEAAAALVREVVRSLVARLRAATLFSAAAG